jgi:hypothetical protein
VTNDACITDTMRRIHIVIEQTDPPRPTSYLRVLLVLALDALRRCDMRYMVREPVHGDGQRRHIRVRRLLEHV